MGAAAGLFGEQGRTEERPNYCRWNGGRQHWEHRSMQICSWEASISAFKEKAALLHKVSRYQTHTHTIDKMGTGCKRCVSWVILETHPHSSACTAARGRAALGKGGHAGVYLPNNTCPRRSGGITRSSRQAATTWLPTQAWQWAEMWFHVVKCYGKAFGEKIHFRLRQHISPGNPC